MKMDVTEAFSHSGFGRFQFKYPLPLIGGGNLFIAFNMCLGIFTLYENKEPTEENPNPIKIYSVSEEFQLTDFEAKFINSCLMFGVLAGNFLIGKLADSYGRRTIGLILVPFTIGTMVASTFLTFDWVSYAIWRFLHGVMNGGLGVSMTVLSLELVENSYWSYLCCAGAGIFGIGLAILAVLARIFNTWRGLTFITSLPNLYLVYVVYKMPESPRWLYSIGRFAEAETIMQDIAETNGSDPRFRLKKPREAHPSGDVSMTSSFNENVAHHEAQNSNPQNANLDTSNTKESGLDIFKSKPTRTRLLAMVITWFSASLIYYGLTLGAGDLGDNVYQSTAYSGFSELPGYVLTIIMMEQSYFGRKRTAMIFYSFTFIFMVLIDIFDLNGKSKLILALSAKMLISGAFAIIYTYCCELFPTTVRSVGLGWSSMSARIGGILAPFAVQLGALIRENDENSGFLFYSIFAVMSTLVLILIPETLNGQIHDNIKSLERSSSRRGRIEDGGLLGDNIESVGLLED